MEVDNISKQWEWEVCRIEKKHAENTHINIHVDSTIDGGENTCSGENTHTYPKSFIYKFSVKFDRLV